MDLPSTCDLSGSPFPILPYFQPSTFKDEAEVQLNKIRTGLASVVLAKDWSPGVTFWAKQLKNYVELKYPLSRKDRAHFAMLFYHLTIAPSMELVLVESFANVCSQLIRKKEKLSHEDLCLPWEPLYKLIDRITFPKSRVLVKASGSESREALTLVHLLSKAQRFFAPETTEQVLQKFLPMMSIPSLPTLVKYQCYLVQLLPVSPPHAIPHRWLPTVFTLWSSVSHCPQWNWQWLHLISSVAEAQCGLLGFTAEMITWCCNIGLRDMYLPVGGSSGGVRVDMKGGNLSVLFSKADRVKILAKLIVWTIYPPDTKLPPCTTGPSGPPTAVVDTLEHLSSLIQAIESFYHPSNHGRWTQSITRFLQHLASEMWRRIGEESKSGSTIPATHHITPALRRDFVGRLRGVAFLSMFGKDSLGITSAQQALKWFSWIDPNMVIPGLLDRIYPSLESLTEAHRTTSSISTLYVIAAPLFQRSHNPSGRKHLASLLHLTIPGIDMNDPAKTVATLMFIAHSIIGIPVWDVTGAIGSGEEGGRATPVIEWSGMEIDPPSGHKQADDQVRVDVEEEDRLCLASTAEFEEWVAKFMRRVFTIFENLPREAEGKYATKNMENGVVNVLMHACEILFWQLSPRLYDMAAKMVCTYATETVNPNATRAIGLLTERVCATNPAKALPMFIPLCHQRILEELSHGASSIPTVSFFAPPVQSDATLHWYQQILNHSVLFAGRELLKYRKEICEILTESLKACKSKQGYSGAGKLIKQCFHALTQIYPLEARSEDPDQWNNPEYMAQHHLRWWNVRHPAEVDVPWHLPSEEETDFAMELVDKFLRPALARLDELMEIDRQTAVAAADANDGGGAKPSSGANAKKQEISHEFCRLLDLVQNLLSGTATLTANDCDESELVDLPVDPIRDVVDGVDSDTEVAPSFGMRKQVEAGYCFEKGGTPLDEKKRTLQRQSIVAVRKKAFVLLRDLVQHFATHREDEVECAKNVIKAMQTVLTDRGITRQKCDVANSSYEIAKSIIKSGFAWEKKLPRYMIVLNAYIRHLNRLKYNAASVPVLPIHQDMIMDLTEMSLSQYAEVRKVAQGALFSSLRYFPKMKRKIVPMLIRELQVTNGEPNTARMKGASYVLNSRPALLVLLRNWKLAAEFVMTICQAQHEDKPSVRELIRKLFVDYVLNMSFPTDVENISPKLSEACDALARDASESLDMQAIEAERGRSAGRYQTMETERSRLIESLLSIIKQGHLHWRFTLMASNFLEILQRPEHPPTSRYAKLLTSHLTSELPQFRRIGIQGTMKMLLTVKQRALAVLTGKKVWERQRSPMKISVDVPQPMVKDYAEKTLLAVPESLELSEEEYGKTLFVDRMSTGWLVWPKSYDVYVAGSESQPDISGTELACRPALDVLAQSFGDETFWNSLMSYMAQEPDPSNGDAFSSLHARLYKSVFQMYGVEFLPVVKPIVERMCSKTGDKNEQRAAAELIAGLVRGSKNWPFERLRSMWDWLVPLLRKTFANSSPDTLEYWDRFMRFVTHDRDPRRVLPLVKMILREEFDPTSQSFFAQAKKLLMIRTVYGSFGWRLQGQALPIIRMLFENLRHPYKQVREAIATNIRELTWSMNYQSHPSVNDMLESHKAHATGGVGNVSIRAHPDIMELVNRTVENLKVWRKEIQPAASGTSDYPNAGKTVLCWIYDGLMSHRNLEVYPFLLPLMDEMFHMQDIHDQQDLQGMASSVLSYAAQFAFPLGTISAVTRKFLEILTSAENWHIRVKALPVVQVFFFRELFLMDPDVVVAVVDTVSDMLLDAQLEVRQLAATTLSGLVRCSQRDAIFRLKKHFEEFLVTKIPKRPISETRPKSATRPPGFNQAVLKRHAGVLGLSCLVQAFPYEVPGWMPEVLVQLAGCLSEPNPIQLAVQKTFSDFRRTHQDTWHEDSLQFSEEQLEILSDLLISPSYYA